MEEVRDLQTIKPEVKVKVEHWRGGRLIDRWEHGGDMVTNFGRQWICNRLGSASPPGLYRRLNWSALGTCQKVPAGSITKFGTLAEIYRGTISYSKDAAPGSASLDRGFSIGSTYAMRSSALIGTPGKKLGTLYCYGTYPVKNVVSGDTINLNYTIGFGR